MDINTCRVFPLLAIAGSQQKEQRYKIAVCDWMILKRQKIGSFQLVHELNGDGVELDMGGLGKREMFDNKLREPHFQQLFRETAQKYQLEVSSIAMSGFYGQSFLERANYKELVQDCLHAMRVMNTKVAFLPLGNRNWMGKEFSTSNRSCKTFEGGGRYGCF